ncbi:MAG: DUF192 domain-containing protein [Desulfomonile tiedjei]|nr:DUF192 domain-containing protein [Desulfomonile tiedjei]
MDPEKSLLLAVVLPVVTGLVIAVAMVETSGSTQDPAAATENKVRKVPLTIGHKTIQAVLADTEALRVQGLLGWDRITSETGMLLDFKMEGTYAIHMQGMKFPIDAIWVDSKGVVKLIYETIPANSGQIYPALFPCRYCLEVKAGFCKEYGVKIGSIMQFGPGQ